MAYEGRNSYAKNEKKTKMKKKTTFGNENSRIIEIIFQNRNKEYGAYALRSEYDLVLTKALFFGIGIFALIATVPLVINGSNEFSTPVDDNSPDAIWVNVDPIVEEVKIEKTPAVQANLEKPLTIDNRVPTPVKEVRKEIPEITQDREKAVLGTENIIGEPIEDVHVPYKEVGPTVQESRDTKGSEVQTSEVDPNTILTKVDINASYKGGIDTFRKRVTDRLDVSLFSGSAGVLSTIVTFVVERDGTISNIKAEGTDALFNKEAERTVRQVKSQWVPASVDGKAVRSYFRFPVSIRFE